MTVQENVSTFDVSMHQTFRVVDSVQEVEGICYLISNAQTNVPRKTNIPSPMETVA
jgi:hypothetical protein